MAILSGDAETQRWFHRAVLKASTHHDDPRLNPMQDRLQRELDRFEAVLDREG